MHHLVETIDAMQLMQTSRKLLASNQRQRSVSLVANIQSITPTRTDRVDDDHRLSLSTHPRLRMVLYMKW